MSTPAQGDSLAVLLGGQRSIAVYNNGASEEVFVRQPPIRLLDRYIELADNEPALIEFVCDKPPGWADSLTDESFFGLYTLARSLNDPRLGRWIEVRRQTVEKLREVTAKKQIPSPSPESPPGSPPAAPSLTGMSST